MAAPPKGWRPTMAPGCCVEVEVADLEFLARLFQGGRAARVDGSGQGVGRVVGQGDGFVEVRGPQHGQDRAEDLFPGQAVFGPGCLPPHERGIVARAFGGGVRRARDLHCGRWPRTPRLAALGVIHHRAMKLPGPRPVRWTGFRRPRPGGARTGHRWSRTITREQAEHFWPWKPKAEYTTPITASSRSASSSMMMAFLPPISATTRLRGPGRAGRWPPCRGCAAPLPWSR